MKYKQEYDQEFNPKKYVTCSICHSSFYKNHSYKGHPWKIRMRVRVPFKEYINICMYCKTKIKLFTVDLYDKGKRNVMSCEVMEKIREKFGERSSKMVLACMNEMMDKGEFDQYLKELEVCQ